MSYQKNSAIEIIDRATALRLLPRRDGNAHKWGVGGLLIVGGAPGYIGAPALAAMAAGRSGAGIVNLAIPRSSIGATATLAPEAVFIPMPESDFSHGIRQAIGAITPVAEKCRALVIGPGLSRDETAKALLAALFGDSRRSVSHALGFGMAGQMVDTPQTVLVGKSMPAVIDADALHWLAERDQWSSNVNPFSLVLTPHVGEFAALTGKSNDDIVADPATAVLDAANEWQQTVVLKAGKAWVSNGSLVRTSDTSVPALATAGSGDVLAGSIGAFLAQGLDPIDAATLAIYVGNEAARKLTSELSSLGVVAGDLPHAISRILADLETEGERN